MKPEISCQDFESELQDRMDRRLPISGNSGLADHAAQCQTCADLYDGFRELEEGLVALGYTNVSSPRFSSRPDSSAAPAESYAAPTADSYIAATADSQIAAAQRSLVHGRYGVIGLVASIAAVLLIALGISGSLNRPGSEAVVAKHVGDDFADGGFDGFDESDEFVDGDRNPDLAAPTAPVAKAIRVPAGQASKSSVIDQIVIEALPIESWNQFSEQLTSSVYYRYSSEIPGVRPIQTSIDIGVDLFQRTFQPKKPRSSNKRPDLGMSAPRSFRQA